MLLELGTGRPLDQPLPQPVDQPIRAGQLLRPLVLPQQLIDQLVRDLSGRPSWASFRAARRNRSDRGYAAIVTTPSDEPVRYTEIRALPTASSESSLPASRRSVRGVRLISSTASPCSLSERASPAP